MGLITRENTKVARVLLVELMGTYFLVLTIALSVGTFLGDVNTAGSLAPLSIGAILSVMIFAGGHISGAHFNPAVTMAIFLAGRKKIDLNTSIMYVIMQLIGGVMGGLGAYAMTYSKGVAPNPNPKYLWSVFFAEYFYTFALVWVVLNTATTKSQKGNSFFGLAIGLTVIAGAVAVGDISGGVFNPAVATGLLLSSQLHGGTYVSAWWVYFVAELLASGTAAGIFYVCNYAEEYENDGGGSRVDSEGGMAGQGPDSDAPRKNPMNIE